MARSWFNQTLGLGLACSAWLGLTPCGHASPQRRPALHWSRGAHAAGCIDPGTLAARVEALTGTRTVAPPDAESTIEGHIEAVPKGGFRARITVTGREPAPLGERVIEHDGANCRDFDDKLVFVIALMIDPDLGMEELNRVLPSPEQAPEATLLHELQAKPAAPTPSNAPAVAASEPPLEQEKLPPQATASPAGAELGAALIASVGELPRAGIGAAANLAWRRAWLAMAAWVRAGAGLGVYRFEGEYGMRTQALSGALLACARYEPRARMWGLCIGPNVSATRAKGAGLSAQESAWLMTYGGIVRADVGVRLQDPWRLDLSAFAGLNLADKRFGAEIDGRYVAAYVLPRTSGGASVGVSRLF